MKIVLAIAERRWIEGDEVDRKTVQIAAGISSDGSFMTTLLNMKNEGLVEYSATAVWLTKKGIEQAGDAAIVPQTNAEAQEKLKKMIKQKRSREMFDLMTDGQAYSRAELASGIGMEQTKSFGTYVSALSKHTTKDEGGKMSLIDAAFPEGRPCKSSH